MKKLFAAYLLLLLLCPGSFVRAQTPAYLHYGVREGLPSNLIYRIVQDRQGFVWLATDKGLVRFDGLQFHVYGMQDGLPDPEVLYMMADSRGRLWLACFRKQLCYWEKGRFITGREDTILAKLGTQSPLQDFLEFEDEILITADDRVWSYQYGGIYDVPLSGPQNFAVMDSVPFILGRRVIYRRQDDGQWKAVYKHTGLNPRLDKFMGVAASGNRVLYSFAGELVLLELRGDRFHTLEKRPGPVGRVVVDRLGRFWVCSNNEGAVCFDNRRRDLGNPVSFLPSGKITDILEDKQGNLWFGTIDDGVYCLPQHSAVIYGAEADWPSDNITTLARRADGAILAGDDEGCVRIISGNSCALFHFGNLAGFNRCRQIVPMPDGKYWLGADQGIHEVAGDQRRELTVRSEGFVKALLHHDNKLWCATSGSLCYFPDGAERPIRVKADRFTSLGIDDENIIWSGGIEGIFSQSDSFQYNWGRSFSELQGRIVAIHPAGPGRLWVVTPRDGLLKVWVKAGRVTGVEVMNRSLPEPIYNIQSLHNDALGRLWLATNRGVFALYPEGTVLHLDHTDGLSDDDVSSVLLAGDTLWAGTASGLTRFVLRAPARQEDFPTLISGMRYQIDNQEHYVTLFDSMPGNHFTRLPPGASLVKVELSALDYQQRGNLRFLCILTEGLPSPVYWTLDNVLHWIGKGFRPAVDTAWTHHGYIDFGVNLPAGCYLLTAYAETAGGMRSDRPATWEIIKRPYWYQTIWFTLLVWCVAGALIWRWARTRAANRELGSAVSQLQLQALQAQINPHFIGNSVNAIQQFFYPPDPGRASEYVELFTRLLRRTMEFSEKTFIPFSEELAYDRDYLAMIQLRFGERFMFSIRGAENIPPNTPFPSMMLQPLLENATMHGLAPSGISHLELQFELADGRLCCTVLDNGIGIRATQAKKDQKPERQSRGLELLHKKAQTLDKLYTFGLKLSVLDRQEQDVPAQGTWACISFLPDKAPALSHPA